MKKLVLLSAACIGLLTSCSKESATISPDLNPATSNDATARKGSSGIKWNTGTVRATKIRFEGKINNVRYSQEYTTDSVFDVFGPIPLGFSNYHLPSGPWSEAEVTVTVGNSSTTPALMLGGDFANSSTTFPIAFQLDQELALKSNRMKGVYINNNMLPAFKADDFEAATDGITGTMVSTATFSGSSVMISSTSNTSMYNTIVSNLQGR
jgi:hypothetical protein